MKLIETVIVEGRDDESAVLAALDANVICTHGYGIRKETFNLIENAYKITGAVIFTDPDHAGNEIRKRITKLCPNALQAYLTRNQAEKDGDIGIENAVPEDIIRALRAAGCHFEGESIKSREDSPFVPVTMNDLVELGLAGTPGSAEKRSAAGAALGIGSANSKTFLRRLEFMHIDYEHLSKAVLGGKE